MRSKIEEGTAFQKVSIQVTAQYKVTFYFNGFQKTLPCDLKVAVDFFPQEDWAKIESIQNIQGILLNPLTLFYVRKKGDLVLRSYLYASNWLTPTQLKMSLAHSQSDYTQKTKLK